MSSSEDDAPALALFDLDGTLLVGDTDELWCAFLIDEEVLDRAAFEPRNRAVVDGYAAGTIDANAFCGFYASLLAGHGDDWLPLVARFVAERLAPRVAPGASALVDAHRRRGERIVLTTATNRFLAPAAAALFGIDAASTLATDLERDGGVCTGRTAGTLNMRAGKVDRLRAWLADQGTDADGAFARASFYSDSSNDLPLLLAVGRPVAVDPDARLAGEARSRGWPVVSLRDGSREPSR